MGAWSGSSSPRAVLLQRRINDDLVAVRDGFGECAYFWSMNAIDLVEIIPIAD